MSRISRRVTGIALVTAIASVVLGLSRAQAAVTAPSNVTVSRALSNVVTVSWTASTGATGYVVKAFTTVSGNATWDSCATSLTSCSGADELHVPRTSEAWIEVSASDGSSTSAAARVKLDALPTAPSAPTLTASATSLDATWAAAGSGVTPTGYAARAYSAIQGGTLLGSCTTNSASALQCSIAPLTNGVTVYVEVEATSAGGNSDPSARTAGTPRGLPTAPTNVQVSGGDGLVSVGWTGPDSDGGSPVTGYRAEAFTQSSGGSSVAYCEPSSLSAMSCDIGSLSNGVTYFIETTARTIAGTGAPSTRIEVQPGTRSTAPRSVSVTRGDGSLLVEWAAPSSDGGATITGYTASAFTTSSSGSPVSTCTTTSLTCTIDGVANATTYYVSVVATTAVGAGQSSSRITVRLSAAPSPPRSVSVVRGNGFATVSWRTPESLNGSVITKYVARAYGQPYSTDAMAQCSPRDSSLRCNLGPLPNGSTYYVDVIAVTARFISDPSSPRVSVLTATIPDVPRDVTAVQRGDGIDVRWRVPIADGGQSIKKYTASAYSSTTSTVVVAECSTTGDSCTMEHVAGPPVYIDVVAQNAVGFSNASEPRVKLVVGGLPSVPRDVLARREGSRATISWRAPVDDGGSPITGYSAAMTDAMGQERGSCTGKRLVGSRYWGCSIGIGRRGGAARITVGAMNAHGTTRAPSVAVAGSTPTPPSDVVAYPAEHSLVVVAQRAPSESSATHYAFRAWSREAGGSELGSCEVVTYVEQPTCTITGLPNYQAVWVDAVSSDRGRVSRSTSRLMAKPMASAPSAPREVTVNPVKGGAVVTWRAPFTDGGYAITRTIVTAQTAVKDGKALGTCIAKSTATSCTIAGLTADYAYFTVQSTNPVGVGPASEPRGRNLS